MSEEKTSSSLLSFMFTSLENTEDEIILENDFSSLDSDDLLKEFFNGDNDIQIRIYALETLANKNIDLCYESVNKITSMFSFSPNTIFRNLIKTIVKNSSLNLTIKIECARAMYDDKCDIENRYECFHIISKIMRNIPFDHPTSVPIPLQIDIVRTLMETFTYYNDTFDILSNIVTNKNLECEYRYKTILGIQKDNSRKFIQQYLNDIYVCFFKHSDTFIRYKILAAQYILQNFKKGIFKPEYIKDITNEVESGIIAFATDTTLDYNLRADAADLLVRLGSPTSKETGKEIIMLLGRNPEGISTVYNNRQNVHDDDIDNSIRKFILFLSSLRVDVIDGKHVSFEDAKREILTIETSKENSDLVKSSLLRISLDQTIYDGGQTLQSIFNKIWRLILTHEYSELLKTRMVEELVDMANTCSSGHISRIVNVLCGFEIEGETFSIEIGWKKQIQSNLIGRLTKKIKDIKDENTRDTILEEMSVSGDISTKKELSTFFRENLLPIRDELYNEFVGGKYVCDDDFEEYFRSAITFFEEGN